MATNNVVVSRSATTTDFVTPLPRQHSNNDGTQKCDWDCGASHRSGSKYDSCSGYLHGSVDTIEHCLSLLTQHPGVPRQVRSIHLITRAACPVDLLLVEHACSKIRNQTSCMMDNPFIGSCTHFSLARVASVVESLPLPADSNSRQTQMTSKRGKSPT
jgi:hypothetical protein